jgi:predicted AAA+ superfamily ATPase
VSSNGSSLAALRTVCAPRDDVVSGGLADNHFAAQLDKVVRDPEHYPVYGDASAFFAQTYPTSGLKTLLTKTFGRVSGAKGIAGENGVLRPTTSFGGGKTHGLTAVYHLAKGERPGNINEFLDPALLPDGPVHVAALVGDALDPTAGVDTNGHRTYTLWGEMAAQVGDAAYEAIAAMTLSGPRQELQLSRKPSAEARRSSSSIARGLIAQAAKIGHSCFPS